jgi:hypothetical protein
MADILDAYYEEQAEVKKIRRVLRKTRSRKLFQ